MGHDEQVAEALKDANPKKALARLVQGWGMDGMTQEKALEIFKSFFQKQATDSAGSGVLLSQGQFLIGQMQHKLERGRFDLAQEGTLPVPERRKLKQRATVLLIATAVAFTLVVVLAGLAAPTLVTLLVGVAGFAAGTLGLLACNRALRGRITMPPNKGRFATWIAPGLVMAAALPSLLLASGAWYPLNEITFVWIGLGILAPIAISLVAVLFLLVGRIELVVPSQVMFGTYEKKKFYFGTYGLPLAFLMLTFAALPSLGAKLGARSPCTQVVENMSCTTEETRTLYAEDGCYGDAYGDAVCRLEHCQCIDGSMVCDRVDCSRPSKAAEEE